MMAHNLFPCLQPNLSKNVKDSAFSNAEASILHQQGEKKNNPAKI